MTDTRGFIDWMNHRRQALTLSLVISVWIAGIGAGFAVVMWRVVTPGPAPRSPGDWPIESHLARAGDRPTLLVFLHPRCPCSRATVSELARTMARLDGRVAVHALIISPPGAPPGWERSPLSDAVAAIPGVVVFVDEQGREASLFGSATSGSTLLYDISGRLRFAGGITAARGHEGDNPGKHAIIDIVLHGVEGGVATEVFGCPMMNKEPESLPEATSGDEA